MFEFLSTLSAIEGLKDIHITTNGTLTAGKVSQLKSIGIKSINLSLDSLDEARFHEITRRDEFKTVMNTLDELIYNNIPTKINCVVMDGRNIDDIIPMVELTRFKPISVRFIEEMPFNGTGDHPAELFWTSSKTIEHIQSQYPDMEKIKDSAYSTSMNYKIPGFEGSIGFIAAYSRLFCGSCNRIRVTPQGVMKTCLYDNGIFNIKDIMRNGATDLQIIETLKTALSHRAKDGFEAERNRGTSNQVSESMATIGG